MFEYELVKKSKINTNRYFNLPDELYPKMVTIYIEEYDIKLKEQENENRKIEIKENEEIKNKEKLQED
jgi:hypothetical protein